MNTVASRTVRLTVAASSCAAALLTIGAHPAGAAPADAQGGASCAYSLSQPFVVEVSGRKMVSATFSSLPCTKGIQPDSQTVCVRLEGGGAPPTCSYLPGYGTAQVYFAPYRPGSTYVSTGRGCGALSTYQVSSCSTRGPLTATL